MRKLSEYKDEEALDLLAALLEPCVELFSDKALTDLIREKDKAKGVSYAIKHHKAEVVQIMATLENVPVKDFHYNVFTLPMMCLNVLNDQELMSFFTSAVRMDLATNSGDVTENTEEEADISSDT